MSSPKPHLVVNAYVVLNINVEPEGAAVGIVGPDLGVGEGVELAGFLLGELGQNICAQFLEPFLVNSFCHNYSSLNVAPFFAALLKSFYIITAQNVKIKAI